jgi:NAD-dependent dihydropyrimidine dehydrogenase PreA subunit
MTAPQTKDAATTQTNWHGIPRQDIPWFPTIDEKACINCGLCYVRIRAKISYRKWHCHQ